MAANKPKGFLNRLLGRSDIVFDGKLYMKRWRILHTKPFGIRIHNIVRSDDVRELHDHPFSFLSIILRSGYIEHTPDGRAIEYRPGSIVFRSAAALHRLDLFKTRVPVKFKTIACDDDDPNETMEVEIPAWTLVFRGPVLRRWGFLAVSKGDWIDADDSQNNKEARAWREQNGQARKSVYADARPRGEV